MLQLSTNALRELDYQSSTVQTPPTRSPSWTQRRELGCCSPMW